MSTQEHVFLDSAMSPLAIAEWFAPLLGMEIRAGAQGEVYLSRPARLGEGEVGGEVYPNFLADPDAGVQDASLIDDFPAVFDVGYTGRDEAVQDDEARALFAELSARVPIAMALVHGFDILVGVSDAAHGLVWLPPGTTPDFRDRAAWERYRPSR